MQLLSEGTVSSRSMRQSTLEALYERCLTLIDIKKLKEVGSLSPSLVYQLIHLDLKLVIDLNLSN